MANRFKKPRPGASTPCPTAPPPLSIQEIQRLGTRAQRSAVAEILSEGCDQANALEVGQNTVWFAQKMARHMAEATRPQIACAAGCAWCCALYVAITVPEALAIADHLQHTHNPVSLLTLVGQLRTRAAQARDCFPHEYQEKRLPCALLDAGARCSVYEVRPTVCAGWNSTSQAHCRQAAEQGNGFSASDLPGNGAILIAAGSVNEGMRQAVSGAGLDAQKYELHSAVLAALTEPDVAQRWRAGETVFAEATVARKL